MPPLAALLRNIKKGFSILRPINFRQMADLEKLPTVVIDPKGTFKYILIEASSGKMKKNLVRGDAESEYHADIFEKCEEFVAENKLNAKLKCLGGGRIKHEPEMKHILIYGHSVGFGKADHSVTCELLKEHYKGYKVEWENGGY